MSDATPSPVHLNEVVEALAENPALPPELVRRLFAHRNGFGEVAKRPDLTDDMIAEIIAIDDHWLTHSLALNRSLPHAFRMALAEHPDPAVRTAVASRAGGDAHRELFERLLGDADPKVRGSLAENDHIAGGSARPAGGRRRPGGPGDTGPMVDAGPRTGASPSADGPRRRGARRRLRDLLPAAAPPGSMRPTCSPRSWPTRSHAPGPSATALWTPTRSAYSAHDPDEAVRKELAEHPGLSAPLRDRLAEDPDPRVALGIFARQDTPEPTRAAIHARILTEAPPADWLDDDQELDDDALERQILSEIARLELRTLRLPWVTADPLPHTESPYVCFRASAAMSDSLPRPVAARLLDDEESSVRTTMARHARDRIDPATAERIDRSHRPYKRTRWRPADDFPAAWTSCGDWPPTPTRECGGWPP